MTRQPRTHQHFAFFSTRSGWRTAGSSAELLAARRTTGCCLPTLFVTLSVPDQRRVMGWPGGPESCTLSQGSESGELFPRRSSRYVAGGHRVPRTAVGSAPPRDARLVEQQLHCGGEWPRVSGRWTRERAEGRQRRASSAPVSARGHDELPSSCLSLRSGLTCGSCLAWCCSAPG